MRIAPVFSLTVRALARGRRLIVIGVLLAVPVLLSLAYRGSESKPNGAAFALQLFVVLVLPILLPLTALILSTTALGNEIEDGTLAYLALRPISRLALVLGKLLAASLVTAAPVELATLLMYLVSVQGGGSGGALLALLLAALLGSVVYCSLFLLLGLLMPRRGLLVGLGYVLVWEGAAAGLSGTLATLSVRRYLDGIIDNLTNTTALTQAHLERSGAGGLSSVLVLLGVSAVAVAATTVRLRRMELP
jgi:ABC-2 type transport system permease protein